MENTEVKSAQLRANKKQDMARKGLPTFSSVRFSGRSTSKDNLSKIMAEMKCDREQAIVVANEQDKSIKANIDRIVADFGGTREQALIAAFEALDKELKSN